MRRSGWKLISAATVASGLLAFIVASSFADYIPEPVLIRTSPKTITVDVNLTASPTEGLAPLSVTFSCTATAEVYYIEVWAIPPQGSVEKEKEITETHAAKIIKMPDDQILEEIKTYPFKATAEYGGVTGEGFATVVVKKPNCADLFAKKAELEKELVELNKQLSKLEAEKEKLEAEKDKKLDKLDEELTKEIFEIDKKIKHLSEQKKEILKKIEKNQNQIIALADRITAILFAQSADVYKDIMDIVINSKKIGNLGELILEYIKGKVKDNIKDKIQENLNDFLDFEKQLVEAEAAFNNCMQNIQEHQTELEKVIGKTSALETEKTTIMDKFDKAAKKIEKMYNLKINQKEKGIAALSSNAAKIKSEIQTIIDLLKDMGCL